MARAVFELDSADHPAQRVSTVVDDDRLAAVEAKLDQVLAFNTQVHQLFQLWLTGTGRGRLLGALIKLKDSGS